MGTLMAFGGKYLREIAFKAYEYIAEPAPVGVDKVRIKKPSRMSV